MPQILLSKRGRGERPSCRDFKVLFVQAVQRRKCREFRDFILSFLAREVLKISSIPVGNQSCRKRNIWIYIEKFVVERGGDKALVCIWCSDKMSRFFPSFVLQFHDSVDPRFPPRVAGNRLCGLFPLARRLPNKP